MSGAAGTDPEPPPADAQRVNWMIAPSSGALPLATPRRRQRIGSSRPPASATRRDTLRADAEDMEPAPARETTSETASATTILLIDDDRPRCELLAIVLTSEGYHVELAPSVHEAARLIERSRPALVIVDERLLHQAGHLMAEQLQQQGLPTLIVDPSDAAHPLLPHAEAITSPPDITQLLDTVARLIGRPQARG
ncbi:MAG: hypothetical protein KatS3mg059_0753 [Thermomicrobiales bacterium]|nr:MAG: hypothetical protein KatS3mg059_0753 [Thermomicrobiales bacterium]